jgi:hypothetical protein
MGTRGFLGWKIDGKITTTYNHFDSYPSGLGNSVLKALTDQLTEIRAAQNGALLHLPEAAVLILGAKFRVLRTITENQQVSAADRKRLAHRHDSRVSTGKDTYALLRHQQGDLTAILDDGITVRAHANWPKDSLFCEWGYLVNFSLPEPCLEVYRGFQHTAPTAGEWFRPNARPPMKPVYGNLPDGSWGITGRRRSEYYPVNRIASFSLLALPETMPDLPEE